MGLQQSLFYHTSGFEQLKESGEDTSAATTKVKT
jgi:hypothetical protein